MERKKVMNSASIAKNQQNRTDNSGCRTMKFWRERMELEHTRNLQRSGSHFRTTGKQRVRNSLKEVSLPWCNYIVFNSFQREWHYFPLDSERRDNDNRGE